MSLRCEHCGQAGRWVIAEFTYMPASYPPISSERELRDMEHYACDAHRALVEFKYETSNRFRDIDPLDAPGETPMPSYLVGVLIG